MNEEDKKLLKEILKRLDDLENNNWYKSPQIAPYYPQYPPQFPQYPYYPYYPIVYC